MSKAENFAVKKYPVSIEYIQGHKIDTNLWQRKACVEGYHQAEKDLKLTWEDMKRVYLLVISVSDMQGWKGTDKSIYQEVLKRFKENKL